MSEKSKSSEQEEYDVGACTPGDLSSAELMRCVALIRQGGAVDPGSANGELPKARVIAIVRIGAEIVGVGTVKRIRRKYVTSVAHKSGVPFDPNTPELGYVAVDRNHQGHGLSERIITVLLSKHKGPLWASTDNSRMKSTLKKAGFVQKGKEWKGQRGGLSLWIRR